MAKKAKPASAGQTTPFKAALKSAKALEASRLIQVATATDAASVDVYIDGVGLPAGTDRVNLASGGHRLRIRVGGAPGKQGTTRLLLGGAVIGSVSVAVMPNFTFSWSAEVRFNVP